MIRTYGPHQDRYFYRIETWNSGRWVSSGFGWAGLGPTGKQEVHYLCFGVHPEVTVPQEGVIPPPSRWVRDAADKDWTHWRVKVDDWVRSNAGKPYQYFQGCVWSVAYAPGQTWDTLASTPPCGDIDYSQAASRDGEAVAPQIFTGYVQVLFGGRLVGTIVAHFESDTHPRFGREVWTTFNDRTFPRTGPYELVHFAHWPVGPDFDLVRARDAIVDTNSKVAASTTAAEAVRHSVQLNSLAPSTKPF